MSPLLLQILLLVLYRLLTPSEKYDKFTLVGEQVKSAKTLLNTFTYHHQAQKLNGNDKGRFFEGAEGGGGELRS